jgi:hypothetical protein
MKVKKGYGDNQRCSGDVLTPSFPLNLKGKEGVTGQVEKEDKRDE